MDITNNDFLEFFHELEGYTLRSERFYDDVNNICNTGFMTKTQKANLMMKWLDASYHAGARNTAQKTVDKLLDVQKDFDLEDDPIAMATLRESFKTVRGYLMAYYAKTLKDVP